MIAITKDLKKNTKRRREILLRCAKDLRYREAIQKYCKHNVLFWMNTFCIAKGTPVVTDRGLVPIEKVESSDRVWDGDQWVSQKGVVFQGYKHTISAYKIRLTEDHKVMTNGGWKEAGERHDRKEVRLPEGYRERWIVREDNASSLGVRLCVREKDISSRIKSPAGDVEELRVQKRRSCVRGENGSRNDRDSGSQCVDSDATAMQKSKQFFFPSLRRTRNNGLQAVGGVREFSKRHGGASGGDDTRKKRQREGVFSSELRMGQSRGSGQQYTEESKIPDNSRPPFDCPDVKANRDLCEYDQVQNKQRVVRERINQETEKKEAVYDLINCGPKKAFTVIDENGDPLLVHNCFVYEPRPRFDEDGKRKSKTIPFITWDHQDVAIEEMYSSLGIRDIGVEKSRGEGMSWIGVLLALHFWLYDDGSKVGLVTRTEQLADDPDDSDSLFWKIDWELKMLPKWMAGEEKVDWKRNKSKHNLVNHRNGAMITASSATGEVFRGGRLTWALMDEFAFFKAGEAGEALNASHGATDSRLFVSTVNGKNTEFYKLMIKAHGEDVFKKVIIDWKQNQTRNRGLYRVVGNRPVAVDPENNPLPENYQNFDEDVQELFARLRQKGFDLKKGHRSPWYDRECDRPGMSPQRIAQELDRDSAGTEHKIFGLDFFQNAEKQVEVPLHQGTITFDPETLEPIFDKVDGGIIKVWMPLDSKGRPPKSSYVIGGDISAGLGGDYTSNSTLFGIDMNTGEQVLEVAANTISPELFGDLMIAIAKWMHEAYLAWEKNGPGTATTKQIMERGYPYIYHREKLWQLSNTSTREPGWWTDVKTKGVMFAEMNRSVIQRDVILRSNKLVDECGQYIMVGGKIEHSAALATDDDTAKGQAHGDRVIAACVCIQAMKHRTLAKIGGSEEEGKIDPDNPPRNTMAHRLMEQDEEEQRRKDEDYWCDDVVRAHRDSLTTR